MAEVIVTLKHGYKTDKRTLMEVVLREATAGDVIEATEESEKLIILPDDNGKPVPQFVPSPTMVGVHVLRRQIVRVGNIEGQFTLEQLKTLSPDDLNTLQARADEMESAATAEDASRAVTQGGRSDSDSAPG